MKGCTHPQNGATIACLPEGVMEIGMGQHGEGGQGGQQPLVSADATAEVMINQLMKKVKPAAGDKVTLIINGVGATTHMELSIIYRKAAMMLEAAGVNVVSGRIAEILTVQEQAGFQMILAKLDDEQERLLKNVPSNAPYWTTLGNCGR